MQTLEITKIVRVGTSLGVVIPIHILRSLYMFRGDHVVLSVADGDIILLRKVTDSEKLQIKPQILSMP